MWYISVRRKYQEAALMLAGELAVQVEEYDLTLPLGNGAALIHRM